MSNGSSFGKAAFIAAILAAGAFLILKDTDHSVQTRRLDETVLSILRKYGPAAEDAYYSKDETFRQGRHTFLRMERHFRVSAGFDGEEFLKDLNGGLKRTKFKVKKYAFEKKDGRESLIVSLSLKNRIIYDISLTKEGRAEPRAASRKQARIAIVLDDLGYNTDNLEKYYSIGAPLTVSVLPNLPYSVQVAGEARGHGLEVILHLPMEPHSEELRLEEGTIMLEMPADEVRGLLAKAIDDVPGLKGISNHMGSKATESRDLMRIVFKEMEKRGLYFLDNLVTDKSVCEEMARETGVRTASRSVFLDNKSDEDYIEKQIARTADLASKTGWAIGVGHDRDNTANVLARVIPRLKEAGYKFVYVSELVN